GMRAGAVLDAEWLSVCSILVQAQKRRKFAEWRDAEKALQLTLSPDFFRIPPTDPSVFPPQDTFTIVEWRATAHARRAWQDKLRARIDQDQAVTGGLADIASATEEAALPALRDALVALVDPSGADLEAQATWVTERFLIDGSAG